MVDVALAAVDVTAMVFVMNGGGWFHRRHLLAEARRHLALVLRGRRREPDLDERIVTAALTAHCTDITDARTSRGASGEYRLYTAQWAVPDRPPRRRVPVDVPDLDPQPDQASGESEIPRVVPRYDRAALASAAVLDKLRTITVVRGRTYDVAGHQQAAMPGQLLPLQASRTDTDALELIADQLRRIREAAATAVEGIHTRTAPHRQSPAPDDVAAPRPVREDDQRAHRPKQPRPAPRA